MLILTNHLFIQVAKNWDLASIIQAIIKIKIQDNEQPAFTILEEIILCGLLCNYPMDTISQQLSGSSATTIVYLTEKVQNYILKIATKNNTNPIPKMEDLLALLSLAKYQKNLDLKTKEEAQKFLPSALGQDLEKKIENKEEANYLANQSLNRYYLSETVDDLNFPSLNRWHSLGGLVITGLLGIGFILAAIIKYDVIVKANAIVRSKGGIKLVQVSSEGNI